MIGGKVQHFIISPLALTIVGMCITVHVESRAIPLLKMNYA